MGAEGSIELFEENQLEDELGMTKDESLKDIFNSSLASMVDVLVHPLRMKYDLDWLKARHNGCDDYKVNEFQYTCADGIKLHCVKWVRDPDARVCIVYLHTNTRCLSDATELLPLCNLLNANLLAFDQRGAGQSEGQFSFRIVEDLTAMLESLCGGNLGVKVVLWARGMASYVAVQYVMQQQEAMAQWVRTGPARRMILRERRLLRAQAREQARERRCNEAIKEGEGEEEEENEEEEEEPAQFVKFVVLDSPFTSLKDVVIEAAKNVDILGASIPPMFVKFALYMVKDRIVQSLEVDPYSIEPLRWLRDSKKKRTGNSLPPCYVLSADNDEHIPASMGAQLAQEWRGKAGSGMCWFREFPGAHFEERDECLVMTPIQAILDFVDIHEVNKCCDDDDEGGEKGVWKSCPGSADTVTDDGKDDDHEAKDCSKKSSAKSSSSSGSDGKSGSGRSKSTQRIWDDAPSWQDSDHVKCCSFCSTAFSLMFRKHHCRRCGLVVCGRCSTSRVPLPARSRVGPDVSSSSSSSSSSKEDDRGGESVAVVRACDSCVNLMHLAFK